ncbi:DUF6274 family protein [Streptomyces sp. NPDC057638]|uniref:DUF6274 family protein n=1 Tax=Streptomyces sp. NPDC057638 TaxID=3346190 RepID=UPI0036A22354
MSTEPEVVCMAAATAGRHGTKALLRAHLAAASGSAGYRHRTRHCPICHRLLALALEREPEPPDPPEAPVPLVLPGDPALPERPGAATTGAGTPGPLPSGGAAPAAPATGAIRGHPNPTAENGPYGAVQGISRPSSPSWPSRRPQRPVAPATELAPTAAVTPRRDRRRAAADSEGEGQGPAPS